jgi:hypothetical protein
LGLLLTQGSAALAEGAGQAAALPPGFGAADSQRVAELNSTAVKDFFKAGYSGENAPGAFDKAFNDFTAYAEKLGVFQNSADFRSWWAANKEKLETREMLEGAGNQALSIYVTSVYLRYAAEKAASIDKAAPGKTEAAREKHELTDGDRKLLDTIEHIDLSSWSFWLIGTAGGMAAGTALAVAKKLSDVFFHGPVAQIMNTTMDPLSHPLNDRITLLVNTHLAPRLIPYTQFMTGEGRRRKKAMKQASAGGELNGGAQRYKHPSISVKDFTAENEEFYKEFMKADFAMRGWMFPELARARNSGFDLVYNQYRLLGEQLTNFQNGLNLTRLLQAQVNRPALKEAGASDTEINAFTRLVRERQDLLVFSDLRDPKIAELEPQIEKILKEWTDRGIPAKVIQAFYETELDSVIAENRPTFLLASTLDIERYFQEHNLALKKLPKMLEWQEKAREMVGFYDALEKHADRIQMFYDNKGVKFDVRARIRERGYPLASGPRPHNVPPVEDCALNFLKLYGKQ